MLFRFQIPIMLAYIRTISSQQMAHVNNKQALRESVAIVMRNNVRNHQRAPLTDIDYRSAESAEVAGALAEIYMREFACLVNTLNQANAIAARYHESVFDNTDDYLGLGQSQSSPDEMTSDQRHAGKLLLSVGKNYSEIGMAIRMLGCSTIHVPRDILACEDAVIEVLAQHFHATAAANPSFVEDAFDRLHHIVKQVWSLTNTLALANLFRFAESTRPIFIATSDDAIFIPHIPTRHL